jgi:opacity protein-like surface antigen
MRSALPYSAMLSASILAAFSSYAASSLPNDNSNSKVIYGLENARHFKTSQDGKFYVQAATFKHQKNANAYKYKLKKKYNQPVQVEKRGNYYVVLIGPVNKAAEIREVSAPVNVKQQAIKHSDNVIIKNINILEPIAGNHFEVIGGLGIAGINASNASMRVTSSEVDTLVQTNNNDWNTFAAQLGIGYLYFLNGAQEYSENLQWFPWVEPEINGYYLGQSTFKGSVWRFGSMAYSMPFQSTRLMFDTALTIASKKQYSLYVIGGIGNAWNRVGYSDSDNSSLPCADQHLALNTTTNSSFAWEVGAGLAYSLNNRVALSLEYLYTDLGQAKTPNSGNTGTITAPVLTSANFNLTSQAALLGLHVAL